jgi:hypothetical protein
VLVAWLHTTMKTVRSFLTVFLEHARENLIQLLLRGAGVDLLSPAVTRPPVPVMLAEGEHAIELLLGPHHRNLLLRLLIG